MADRTKGLFDYAISGAGPAGSAAAAVLARAGRSVLLLESSSFGAPRVGEALTPAIQMPLRTLGVWHTFLNASHPESPGIVAAWGTADPKDTDYIFTPYSIGWQVDRRAFDHMLAQNAAACGAHLVLGAALRQSQRANDGQWHLVCVCRDQQITYSARFLIHAQGRCFAPCDRSIFDHQVALVGSVILPSKAEDVRTLVEAQPSGWWYSALVSDRELVLAFQTDRDLLPKGKQALEKFWFECLAASSLTARRALGAVPKRRLRLVQANSTLHRAPFGEDYAVIGDAAAAFDPLAGRGVHRALLHGIEVGEALLGAKHSPHDLAIHLQTSLLTDYSDYLRGLALHYGYEVRWSDQIYWRRRHVRDLVDSPHQGDPTALVAYQAP